MGFQNESLPKKYVFWIPFKNHGFPCTFCFETFDLQIHLDDFRKCLFSNAHTFLETVQKAFRNQRLLEMTSSNILTFVVLFCRVSKIICFLHVRKKWNNAFRNSAILHNRDFQKSFVLKKRPFKKSIAHFQTARHDSSTLEMERTLYFDLQW